MRNVALIVISLAVFAASAAPATAQIQGQSLATNLAYPLQVAAPPGDTERLFIVGQQGAIRILKNGTVLARPFLDITPEVLFPGGEQGLLGLAFHPEYDENGWFYINFITGTGAGSSVIRRYTVSSDPDSADVASAHPVLTLVQLQTNHNGGHLLFDDDGYLWTGFGDGGTGGWSSQDLLRLFGKLLRLDVNGDDFPGDPSRNYAIPPGNPFVGNPNALDEIWSRGWRNPWRFSFDRMTGDLWVGDVGQHSWEEINFEPEGDPGGRNYGWDLMEGDECYIPPKNCNDGSLTIPVHQWPHGETTCHSASGGYVYRGSELPSWLHGHYFFSDYCLPAIWSFRYEGGEVTEFTDWTATLDVGGAMRFPASFWEDDAGELYVVEYRVSLGEIWKLVPDSSSVAAPEVPVASGGVSLGAPRPNPASDMTRFDVFVEPGTSVDVAVYDAAGRRVRQIHRGETRASVLALGWDGKDGAGRRVASGAYFVRAATPSGSAAEQVIRLR